MRKYYLFLVVAAFLAANVNAQEANIFASGLKVSSVTGDFDVDFSYTLNADASSLTINVENGDSFTVTEAANLTKGSHKVTKRLTTLKNGDFYWSITAKGISAPPAVPTKVTADEDILKFGPSRSLAVDNYFDSPGFGRVYVTTRGTDGVPTTHGIYILDAALTDVTGQGKAGYKLADWNVSASAPINLGVGPDGMVYTADWWTAKNSCVMDLSGNLTKTLTKAGATVSVWATGSLGKDLILYTVDDEYPNAKFELLSYLIGDSNLPYTGEPQVLYDLSAMGIANFGSLLPDGQGGWWICQQRGIGYDTAANPSLIHIDSRGNRNYSSDGFFGSSVGGSMAINADNTRIAIGGTKDGASLTKQVSIYDLEFDASDVPSFSNPVHIETNDVETSVQFDNAGNLYVLNGGSTLETASVHILSVYALPKAENSFTTPAPVSQVVKITGVNAIGKVLSGKDVKVFCEDGRIKVIGGELGNVFDLQGRIVGSAPETKGVYLVQVKTDNGTVVKKIVK